MNELFSQALRTLEKYEPQETINIMEVCGTHTMAISRNGLRQKLGPNINLVSGPGCPVCVTAAYDIDWLIELVKQCHIKVFTFGDMVRVPGTRSSLAEQKSMGKDISICYSPADALDYALANPTKEVLFVAIGFETTAPLTAVIVKQAFKKNVKNFSVLTIHKLVPPALKLLLQDGQVQLDGLLCPGHVSAIIGLKPYAFIPRDYGIPCVVSGFEPSDIMVSVAMILKQQKEGKPQVQNQYKRVVKQEGNPLAVQRMVEVFEKSDAHWRGLGKLPESGLALKDPYRRFDARYKFTVGAIDSKENPACECGDVLKGVKKPPQCKLFGKGCTPQKPIGPCMVSSEGACAAYYKYERMPFQKG